MLGQMRRGANSWLIVLMFAAIIFVFAINFGPWAGNVGGGTPYAADVNGRVITIAQFQSAYAMQFRTLQNYRPDFTHEQAEAEGLRPLVIDQLVSKELLAQLAERHGLSISDDELAKFIREHMFGKDKPFDREAYKQAIYSNFHISESQFEAQIRRELLADRAGELLSTGIYASDAEVKSTFETRNTRVSLDVINIDPNTLTVSVPKGNTVSDAEISKYYDEHIKEFRTPKQVHARHILIKGSKEKLEKIAARIAKGEDFAKVAKETSEDASAKNGGDLGFFAEGTMVKPFEEVAFKLQPGQVSEIVQTPFGYHLIKVEEVKMPIHKELAAVKTEIAERMSKSQAQKEAAVKMANNAIEQWKAGAKPKETMTQTGFFRSDTRFVPGVGISPDLVKAAFALTKENPVASKPFEINGHLYAIRLKDRESADMSKFEQDKEMLRASLLMTRRREFLQDYVAFLKKDASIKYNAQIMGRS